MDLSHIYGDDLDRQNKLRLMKDGKLRYQVGSSSKQGQGAGRHLLPQSDH